MTRRVCVTGGTGYIGRALLPLLRDRGHLVTTLIRTESKAKVPEGVRTVRGNALDTATLEAAFASDDTVIHLVGTPHPSPAKAAEFLAVDLPSIRATVQAATVSRVHHLIYVSVAHPAPVMHAYINVRREGEDLIRRSGVNATVLRPWYVLGPGHRWPVLLVPAYAVLRRLPMTRESADRLGLVTLTHMLGAIVYAVEHPATGMVILDVTGIRTTSAMIDREGSPA